jgi:flagellar basal-body rod modification protein FlgD
MSVSNVSSQKTMESIIKETENKSKEARNTTGVIGKDDFLKLLVTQLKYQDPMNPTDDKEFVGQMAQFSALEQMQNMNSSTSKAQAFSLIGKHITADIIDATTKETKTVDGDVSGVKIENGATFLVVGDKEVPIDKITNVTEGSGLTEASKLTTYSNLIGCNVQGLLYDPKTSEYVSVKGLVKEIQKGINEDYAVMDGVKVNVSGINDGGTSSDPNYKTNYLESHMIKDGSSIDNTVSIIISDKDTGYKVAVKAKLKDYEVNRDGTISATVDNISVPMDTLVNINKENATTTEQSKLK